MTPALASSPVGLAARHPRHRHHLRPGRLLAGGLFALLLLAAPVFAAPEGQFCRSLRDHTRTYLFDVEAGVYQELICADHCALSRLTLDYDGTYFLNLSDPYVPSSIGFNKITSELFVTSHNKNDADYLKAIRYTCVPMDLQAFELDATPQ